MNIKEYTDHMKRYGVTRAAMDTVNDIFIQNDARYEDFLSHSIVAGFIAHDALSISSQTIKDPKSEDIAYIKGPQQDLKRIAAWLLKKKGFKVKGCEISVPGGLTDLVGIRDNEQILVECGPCRINKPICYLDKPNTVLWIVKWDGKDIVFHEVSRGKNWDSFLEFHKKEHIRFLKDAIRIAKL